MRESLDELNYEMLGAMVEDGSFLSLPSDEAALFAGAVDDAPGLAADEKDLLRSTLLSSHAVASLARTAQEVQAMQDADDARVHEPACAGILSRTGASPEQYGAALQAYDAGDPSDLLALRTAYLQSVF